MNRYGAELSLCWVIQMQTWRRWLYLQPGVSRRLQTECVETETGDDVFTRGEKPQEEEGSGELLP